MSVKPMTSGRMVAFHTSLNSLGTLVPLLVALVCIPSIVWGLGTEKFGLLSLVWVVFVYSSLFDLGVGRAVTRFIAQRERMTEVFWTSFWTQICVGWIGAALMFLFAGTIAQILNIPGSLLSEARLVFIWTGAFLPVVLVTSVVRGALEGVQAFGIVNSLKGLGNSGVFLVPLLGVVLGWPLWGIVLGMGLVKLAVLLGYFLFCLGKIPQVREPLVMDIRILKLVVQFGGWVTVYHLCVLATYSDRLIIGSLLSLEDLSYYSAAYEIVGRLWILPWALSISLLPVFASLYGLGEKESIQYLFHQSIGKLLVIMVPIVVGLVLLGKVVLQWYLGPEYAEGSILALQILGVGLLFNCLAFVPYSYFQGIGRPDIPAKVLLVLLPIHLGLLWFLTNSLGIVGTAIAWSFWAGLGGILLWLLGRKWILS